MTGKNPDGDRTGEPAHEREGGLRINRRDVMKGASAGAALTGLAGVAGATEHGNWECQSDPFTQGNGCDFEEPSDNPDCEYCKLDTSAEGTYTIPNSGGTELVIEDDYCVSVESTSGWCNMVLKSRQDCVYYSADTMPDDDDDAIMAEDCPEDFDSTYDICFCSPEFEISHITVQSDECCECDYAGVSACLNTWSCCEVSGRVTFPTDFPERCAVDVDLTFEETGCDVDPQTVTASSPCFEWTLTGCDCTPDSVVVTEPDGTPITTLDGGDLNCYVEQTSDCPDCSS